MKRIVLVFAAIGIVQCFAAIGHGMTLSSGGQTDTTAFYRVLVALGLAFVIGCTRGKFRASDAAVVVASLGFVLFSLRYEVSSIVADGPRGGRYLLVATVAGLVAAIIGLVTSLREKRVSVPLGDLPAGDVRSSR
jgi:hypothetical protein